MKTGSRKRNVPLFSKHRPREGGHFRHGIHVAVFRFIDVRKSAILEPFQCLGLGKCRGDTHRMAHKPIYKRLFDVLQVSIRCINHAEDHIFKVAGNINLS